MNLITADQLEQNGIQDANGQNSSAMANRVRTLYLPVVAGTTYRCILKTNTIYLRNIHYYKADYTWISTEAKTGVNLTTGWNFTTPAECAYIRIAFQRSNANASITPQQLIDEASPTITINLVGAVEKLNSAATQTNINHNGQLKTGWLIEGLSQAGIRNYGYTYSNEIIEY